mmetsp:Transcript_20533/g.25179  ORF Transcript_20533/g.25179 Transcript_20533/m.25179 type:complete len:472 (+) Transcript_20533:26-1441(+)
MQICRYWPSANHVAHAKRITASSVPSTVIKHELNHLKQCQNNYIGLNSCSISAPVMQFQTQQQQQQKLMRQQSFWRKSSHINFLPFSSFLSPIIDQISLIHKRAMMYNHSLGNSSLYYYSTTADNPQEQHHAKQKQLSEEDIVKKRPMEEDHNTNMKNSDGKSEKTINIGIEKNVEEYDDEEDDDDEYDEDEDEDDEYDEDEDEEEDDAKKGWFTDYLVPKPQQNPDWYVEEDKSVRKSSVWHRLKLTKKLYFQTWEGFFDNWKSKPERNQSGDDVANENDEHRRQQVSQALDTASDISRDAMNNVGRNVDFLKKEGASLAQEASMMDRDDAKEWLGEQIKLATLCLKEFMTGYREGRDMEFENIMDEFYFRDNIDYVKKNVGNNIKKNIDYVKKNVISDENIKKNIDYLDENITNSHLKKNVKYLKENISTEKLTENVKYLEEKMIDQRIDDGDKHQPGKNMVSGKEGKK